MIADIIRRIGERLNDFKGVILIGSDGFIVDKYGIEDSQTESIVIEILAVIRKLESSISSKDQKPLRTLTITGDNANYLLYNVVNSYYLFMAYGDRAHQGQCRYELKKASMDLIHELT